MSEARTPLHDWHVAQKARMVPFAGWHMPVQYSGIIDEHKAVRESAGLFDISHMGRLVFEGPDAEALIQHVWTNDASKLKPGQVRYGLVCNEAGGILDDVLVYRFDPFWMMVVNASNREKILGWLDQHRGDRDVSVTDSTSAWAMIAVQGPKAIDAVTPLVGDYSHLKYYTGTLTIAENPYSVVVVSRTGYTGEDGLEIILPADKATGLANDLVGKAGVKPCGLGARDTLRLEAAMPLYGHELSELIDPMRAGLTWAVKLGKGDFVGRDAIEKAAADSARVGLELDGKRAAREGCTVRRDGNDVGTVTSGSFSPTLGKSIAMAYVEKASSEPGMACEVDIRGQSVPGRVVELPFYSRKK